MFSITSEAAVNDDPQELELSTDRVYHALVWRARANISVDPDLVPRATASRSSRITPNRLLGRATPDDDRESVARLPEPHCTAGSHATNDERTHHVHHHSGALLGDFTNQTWK
ncbi:hypothetical protein [Nocardia sp. NPDC057272]|uniref:hypothetical protein n=1 Tax=Nocardia sp. NPDC057272 TaxID=3346079 RepID=UPI00362BD252